MTIYLIEGFRNGSVAENGVGELFCNNSVGVAVDGDQGRVFLRRNEFDDIRVTVISHEWDHKWDGFSKLLKEGRCECGARFPAPSLSEAKVLWDRHLEEKGFDPKGQNPR